MTRCHRVLVFHVLHIPSVSSLYLKAKVAARVAKEKVALAKGEFEKRRSDVWVCVLCSRSNYWRLKKCRICKRPRVDVLHPPEEGTTTDPGTNGTPDSSGRQRLLHRQQVAAVAAANAASASSAAQAVSDTGDGGSSQTNNNSSLSATTSSIDGVAPAVVLSEFDKREWERRTEERIRDELEAEMKEQLHLLVNRYTRSKVLFSSSITSVGNLLWLRQHACPIWNNSH